MVMGRRVVPALAGGLLEEACQGTMHCNSYGNDCRHCRLACQVKLHSMLDCPSCSSAWWGLCAQEPLLLVAAFFAFFSTIIVYMRCDFNLLPAEKTKLL